MIKGCLPTHVLSVAEACFFRRHAEDAWVNECRCELLRVVPGHNLECVCGDGNQDGAIRFGMQKLSKQIHRFVWVYVTFAIKKILNT